MEKGHGEVITLLMKRGARFDITDANDETARDIANRKNIKLFDPDEQVERRALTI